MGPMRVRVNKIVDFGSIVSLVGTNDEDGKDVVIHVDQRPFQHFWNDWAKADFEQPIEYEADCLILNVALEIDQLLDPRAEAVGHD